MKKSIKLFLLMFLLLQSTILVHAEGEKTYNGFTYTVSNEEVYISKYEGTATDLVIPSTIEGYPVVQLGNVFLSGTSVEKVTIPNTVRAGDVRYYPSVQSPASGRNSGPFTGCATLTEVIFEDGMEVIPPYICYRIENLKSISIPSSVTRIEQFAFAYCGNMETVKLPDELTYLGPGAFYGTTINELTIPKGTEHSTIYSNNINYYALTKAVIKNLSFADGTTYIPSRFCYMSYVENVSIPDTVTEIGDGAFRSCSIAEISLPDSIKRIGAEAFYYCYNLKKCELGNGVTEVGTNAFYRCGMLTELNLPSTVTTLGDYIIRETAIREFTVPKSVTTCSTNGSLTRCSTLEKVIFEDGIKEIPAYICRDTSIASVEIPASVTKVGAYAFYNCQQLELTELTNQIQEIGSGAFERCFSITEFKLPSSLETMGANIFSNTPIEIIIVPKKVKNIMLEGTNGPFSGCTTLRHVTLQYGTLAIPEYMFYGSTIKTVTIPDSVVSIGKCAFQGSGLTNITIPDSVVFIGECTFQDTALKNVILPDSLKKIGDSAFWNCTQLESAELSSNLTIIPHCLFYKCSSLKSIVIPEGVTEIQSSAFWCCESLKSCIFPESLTGIGRFAFDSCVSLTTCDLPENLIYLDGGAFRDCKSLISCRIPDSISYIKGEAFMGNSSLEKAEFYESKRTLPKVTDLVVDEVNDDNLDVHTMSLEWMLQTDTMSIIYENTFENCSNLKTVVMSNQIGKIGFGVFYNCTSLESIIYRGTEEEWNKMSIESYRNGNLFSVAKSYVESESTKNVDGFKIQISTEEKFLKPQVIDVKYDSEEPLKKIVDAKEKEKTYYIRICAYGFDKEEQGFIHGKWSDVTTLTVKNMVTAKEIQEAVKKFYELTDKYLEQVSKEAEADSENIEKAGETPGEILMKADDDKNSKLITFTNSNLTYRQKLKVYEVLAGYMNSVTEFNLEKIDVSKKDDLYKVQEKIIKAVSKSMTEASQEYIEYTEVGIVTLNLTGFSKSFAGDILLNGNQIAECDSGMKGSWNTLTKYIENLSKVTNDLMYQSLVNIFDDMITVTQVKDVVEKDIKATTEAFGNELLDAGYGEIRKIYKMIEESDAVLKAVKEAVNKSTLEEVLKDSEAIWKKIEGMDFSDEKIKKDFLSELNKEVENQRKDLAKLLYAYTYGLEKEEPTSKTLKWLREHDLKCPIDVIVYDANGEELGSIINGVASYRPPITMKVEGNIKKIWMSGEADYTIKIIGTGTGTMNYVVKDLKAGDLKQQKDYFDVPIEEGIVYEQVVKGGNSDEFPQNGELVSNGFSFPAIEHLIQNKELQSVNVSHRVTEGGSLSGDSGKLKIGTTACLVAKAKEGYRFDGWYADGNLVETEECYRFVVTKDVIIEARFEKIYVFHPEYTVNLKDETKNIYLVKDKDDKTGTNDQIFIYEDSEAESIKVTLEKYATIDASPEIEVVECKKDKWNRYVLETLDIDAYQKISLKDESGILIASMILVPETCKEGKHVSDNMVVLEKASLTKDGTKIGTCKICEKTYEEKIYKVKNIKLSYSRIAYNGSVQKPTVVVENANNEKIKSDNYTVKYASGLKAVGKYKVTVTLKGDYKGTKELYYYILPKAPKNAKAKLYGYNDVKVTWKKSVGATGYRVYYKQSTAKTYKKFKATTGTSIKFANLSDGVKYNFKIVPYIKESGKSVESSYTVTKSTVTLKKVSKPKVIKNTTKKVKVSWSNISGETGYQISKATKKTGTNIVTTYKTTSGKSKIITAAKGKTYYYKVRAYKIEDGKKIYGPWSTAVKYVLK